MRIIAGTFRSRTLEAPRGLATRPTSDRLRETLFNVLAPRIEGAVFADLYAGSGAVGIEAISRGANSLLTPDGIVIAEHSRKMLQPLAECYGPLKRYRVLEQGDAGLSFYTR